MPQKFIRIYKKMDLYEIKRHLLIYGDLNGQCANCQAMEIKIDETKCPSCSTEFKYLAFRQVAHHIPKMQKLNEERHGLIFVDHDDFKKLYGALKAEEFFK